MLSPGLSRGRLFCRLAGRRQRLLELLLTPRASPGARAQNSRRACRLRSRQVVSVSRSPRRSRRKATMRSASGPRGTASRGAASSQSMMSAPWPPIRSRRSRGRSFRRRLGRIKNERCLLNLLADEGVAEVFRPVLAEGLRFRNLASMRKGMSPERPVLSRTLRSVGWMSAQTVLIGAEFVPARHARDVMGNYCPCVYCQARTEQLTRPAGPASKTNRLKNISIECGVPHRHARRLFLR